MSGLAGKLPPGMAVVLSAPSGGGKSSVCRRLAVSGRFNLAISVSHTTRPPRGSEREGLDYHFIDDAGFDRLLAADGFVEWAPVHAHRYGTSRAELARIAAGGNVPLFDVDIQGGMNLRIALPGAVLIFILPPSLAELERRLRGRRTDGEEQLRIRLQAARQEIRMYDRYDYLVVNDDLDRAVATVEAILVAESCRSERTGEHARGLLHDLPG